MATSNPERFELSVSFEGRRVNLWSDQDNQHRKILNFYYQPLFNLESDRITVDGNLLQLEITMWSEELETVIEDKLKNIYTEQIIVVQMMPFDEVKLEWREAPSGVEIPDYQISFNHQPQNHVFIVKCENEEMCEIYKSRLQQSPQSIGAGLHVIGTRHKTQYLYKVNVELPISETETVPSYIDEPHSSLIEHVNHCYDNLEKKFIQLKRTIEINEEMLNRFCTEQQLEEMLNRCCTEQQLDERLNRLCTEQQLEERLNQCCTEQQLEEMLNRFCTEQQLEERLNRCCTEQQLEEKLNRFCTEQQLEEKLNRFCTEQQLEERLNQCCTEQQLEERLNQCCTEQQLEERLNQCCTEQQLEEKLNRFCTEQQLEEKLNRFCTEQQLEERLNQCCTEQQLEERLNQCCTEQQLEERLNQCCTEQQLEERLNRFCTEQQLEERLNQCCTEQQLEERLNRLCTEQQLEERLNQCCTEQQLEEKLNRFCTEQQLEERLNQCCTEQQLEEKLNRFCTEQQLEERLNRCCTEQQLEERLNQCCTEQQLEERLNRCCTEQQIEERLNQFCTEQQIEERLNQFCTEQQLVALEVKLNKTIDDVIEKTISDFIGRIEQVEISTEYIIPRIDEMKKSTDDIIDKVESSIDDVIGRIDKVERSTDDLIGRIDVVERSTDDVTCHMKRRDDVIDSLMISEQIQTDFAPSLVTSFPGEQVGQQSHLVCAQWRSSDIYYMDDKNVMKRYIRCSGPVQGLDTDSGRYLYVLVEKNWKYYLRKYRNYNKLLEEDITEILSGCGTLVISGNNIYIESGGDVHVLYLLENSENSLIDRNRVKKYQLPDGDYCVNCFDVDSRGRMFIYCKRTRRLLNLTSQAKLISSIDLKDCGLKFDPVWGYPCVISDKHVLLSVNPMTGNKGAVISIGYNDEGFIGHPRIVLNSTNSEVCEIHQVCDSNTVVIRHCHYSRGNKKNALSVYNINMYPPLWVMTK
ncbi:uncharacterized protein LOC141908659 [Tubulanus polymorphus]|uniref:uncharacterized protein LOC141908659 n=1 Tax=Tubulanus polymorphus TaxID=672921 RepID=UPI003DA2D714